MYAEDILLYLPVFIKYIHRLVRGWMEDVRELPGLRLTHDNITVSRTTVLVTQVVEYAKFLFRLRKT